MTKTVLDKEFALGGKKLPILIYPNPSLDKTGEEITEFNDEIKTLAQDMLTTMYDAPGIGLAAVQVGILKRAIVIDVSKPEEKKKPIFLVNPKITFKSNDYSTYEEGCLSLPGHFAEIERPFS